MTSALASTDIESARQLLRDARHAVVFSGAGISTPSGIPDFRSKGSGMWESVDPMEVATRSTFLSNPQKFWDWKHPLMLKMWDARPNPAHKALAQLESAGYVRAVITQNIDGLHQRAGSHQVFPVHGSIDEMVCLGCRSRFPSRMFESLLRSGSEMPTCKNCRQVLKPDIVLFQENLPAGVWEASEKQCARADVIMVVGSSLEVWPAAYLPEMAVDNGAKLIIVNLSATHLDSRATILLQSDLALALPAITAGLV